MKKNDLEKMGLHSYHPVPSVSGDDSPVYEQRYLPRWQIKNRAYYRTKNNQVIARTQTMDLSIGGACLSISPEVHPSQKLKLKIYLSDTANFEAEGTVVWKRTTADQHCFAGIAFEHVPETVQQLLLANAFEVQYLRDIQKHT